MPEIPPNKHGELQIMMLGWRVACVTSVFGGAFKKRCWTFAVVFVSVLALCSELISQSNLPKSLIKFAPSLPRYRFSLHNRTIYVKCTVCVPMHVFLQNCLLMKDVLLIFGRLVDHTVSSFHWNCCEQWKLLINSITCGTINFSHERQMACSKELTLS